MIWYQCYCEKQVNWTATADRLVYSLTDTAQAEQQQQKDLIPSQLLSQRSTTGKLPLWTDWCTLWLTPADTQQLNIWILWCGSPETWQLHSCICCKIISIVGHFTLWYLVPPLFHVFYPLIILTTSWIFDADQLRPGNLILAFGVKLLSSSAILLLFCGTYLFPFQLDLWILWYGSVET